MSLGHSQSLQQLSQRTWRVTDPAYPGLLLWAHASDTGVTVPLLPARHTAGTEMLACFCMSCGAGPMLQGPSSEFKAGQCYHSFPHWSVRADAAGLGEMVSKHWMRGLRGTEVRKGLGYALKDLSKCCSSSCWALRNGMRPPQLPGFS